MPAMKASIGLEKKSGCPKGFLLWVFLSRSHSIRPGRDHDLFPVFYFRVPTNEQHLRTRAIRCRFLTDHLALLTEEILFI